MPVFVTSKETRQSDDEYNILTKHRFWIKHIFLGKSAESTGQLSQCFPSELDVFRLVVGLGANRVGLPTKAQMGTCHAGDGTGKIGT